MRSVDDAPSDSVAVCARGRLPARPISSNDYARRGPVAEDGEEGARWGGERGVTLSPQCCPLHYCCSIYFADSVTCEEFIVVCSKTLWELLSTGWEDGRTDDIIGSFYKVS